MRNRIVFAAIAVALLAIIALCVPSFANRDAWMPAWFSSPHSVAWKEIDSRPPDVLPDTISKKEAFEDLATFKYLLETSYSGYEYQRKFNHTTFFINFCRAKARVILHKGNSIPRERFAVIVAKCLWGARDGHFNVTRAYRPYTHEDFYRADVTVKRRDGALVVDESSVPGIAVGSRYRDSAKYLFRVWSPEGERWRIGTLSGRPVESLALKIGKGRARVPLANSASPPVPEIGKVVFARDGELAYLRVPSFCAADGTDIVTEDGKRRLEEITGHLKDLSSATTAIVDLRDNSGGYTNIASAIPAACFNRPMTEFLPETAALTSPGIAQASLAGFWDLGAGDDTSRLNRTALKIAADNQRANPRRYWTRAITRTKSIKPVEAGKRLIVILNRRSASASELLCACRSIPGVTIIGENSAGATCFTDILPYYLPRSGIPLFIPSTIHFDLSYSAGEGTGVIPDYWASDGELETTIRGLTGKPDFTIPRSAAAK